MFHLRELKREQTKQKVNKRQEIIKIRIFVVFFFCGSGA
jgi:hypothetical protein